MGKPVFYINGKFVEEHEAAISIMDHGFLYGDGIFEAFRAYKGRIFQFDTHMNRLYDSAKIIGLDIPLSQEEFKKVIIETVRKSGYQDCYIRPQVTRGIGLLGCDPVSCKKSTVVVYVVPLPGMKKGSLDPDHHFLLPETFGLHSSWFKQDDAVYQPHSGQDGGKGERGR